MPRRSGTTLMEVLIAIFVMGIGLMSVMALFPTGALRMAAAIKDDRAGHAAANARAIAIAKNIRFDALVKPFFDNPQIDQQPTLRSFGDAPLHGQSYPIFVDPRGVQAYGGASVSWIAGDTSGIRRRTLDFVQNPVAPMTQGVAALKWCTLLDEVLFAEKGQATTLEDPQVQRGSAVSWAWMLRRPKAGVPSVCDVMVVVYNQRPLVAGLAAKEVRYTAEFDPAQPNSIKLTWGGGTPSPQLSAGDWVLDATPGPLVPPVGGKFTPGNARFHRLVNVGDELVDLTGTKFMEIELEKPLQPPSAGSWPLSPGPAYAAIVVMEGVVEVIECGPGWNAGS